MLTGPSDEESRRNRPRDWSRYILAFYNAKLVKDPGVVGGLYMLMELAMGGDLFDKIGELLEPLCIFLLFLN